MSNQLLTVKKLSPFLGVHTNTVYKWVKQGEIPYVKIKGRIRFKKEEIEEYLKIGSINKHQIAELLPKFDLSLDAYDRMLLKRRTELKGQIRWNYGIGSVILRKTKNKEDRYYIDFQIDKLRIREIVKGARTRAEAVKVLNSKVTDALRGKYNLKKENLEITFSEMADLYLEKYAKKNKEKSWKTSDWVYLRRLKPYFGSSRLSDITTEKVEDYKSERLSGGLKNSSVNRELSCLRKIFNKAIDWGYASNNPVRRVEFLSENESLRERVLTEDEESRLFESISPHLRLILMVALNTGMRKGEIFNLKWEDIDFESRKIRISKSKSGRGRTIPMNSILFSLLSGLKSQNGKTEFVFTNPETGKPYIDIKKAFNGACKRAGIKNLHFHDLRHTFASRLIKRGVDLIIAKELLGHSSVVTTQRYLHSQAREKMEAVETLSKKASKNKLEWQKNVKFWPVNFQGEAVNSSFLNN